MPVYIQFVPGIVIDVVTGEDSIPHGLDPKKIGLSGSSYNPVPWVDNYLDSSNVKSAPQEIESVNYIAAIDNSKDTDFTMDEL